MNYLIIVPSGFFIIFQKFKILDKEYGKEFPKNAIFLLAVIFSFYFEHLGENLRHCRMNYP